MDSDLPISICWHCDIALDAATDPEDESLVPTEGAVSICIYCGAVGIFGPDLALRAPTEDELDEFGHDREFRQRYTQYMWARQYIMRRESLMRARKNPDR